MFDQQFAVVGIVLIFLSILAFGLISSVKNRMQKRQSTFDDAMHNVPGMNCTPTF